MNFDGTVIFFRLIGVKQYFEVHQLADWRVGFRMLYLGYLQQAHNLSDVKFSNVTLSWDLIFAFKLEKTKQFSFSRPGIANRETEIQKCFNCRAVKIWVTEDHFTSYTRTALDLICIETRQSSDITFSVVNWPVATLKTHLNLNDGQILI